MKQILLLLLIAVCLSGCYKKTRTMQEDTKLDLVAKTWAGDIHVQGTINRVQNEQTELKLSVPDFIKNAGTAAVSYLSGAGGVVGLGYALYATIRKRRMLVAKKEEQDVYLREICKGIAKFLNQVDEEVGEHLKRCLREATSRDTRDAMRDFI